MLSRQHYVKILEASTTIDTMLNCALSIEALFTRLDEFDDWDARGKAGERTERDAKDQAVEGSAPVGTPGSLDPSSTGEAYEKLECVWNQIHDGKYLAGARLLAELRGVFDLEIARPTAILLELCYRTIRLLTDAEQVARIAEAVKSVSVVRGKPVTAVLVEVTKELTVATDGELVPLIRSLCQIADTLAVDKAEVIEPLMDKCSLDRDEGLRVALALAGAEAQTGYLKHLADKLFQVWLDGVPSTPTLEQLFELSCQLSPLAPAGLPKEWLHRLGTHLQTERPRGMELILAPVFGVPAHEELQGQDPAITETLFVPTALPRVKKLGS